MQFSWLWSVNFWYTTVPQHKKQQKITASDFMFVSNDLSHQEGKISGRLERMQGHCVLRGGAIMEEEPPVSTKLFKENTMRDGEEICKAFKEAMMDLMSPVFTKTCAENWEKSWDQEWL